MDFCHWLELHGSTCAELAGSVILAINVYLVTRESIWSWPVAVVGSSFYIVVYQRSGLYSDLGLQVVYIVLSLYGWYHWLHGGTQRAVLPVGRTPAREALWLGAGAVALWFVLYRVTSLIPGTSLPMLDSALVAASLAAQWMMTRKYLESWVVWIAVDVVYVPMYFYKHLYLTALLYLIFLGLSVLGHVEWKRSYVLTSRASS